MCRHEPPRCDAYDCAFECGNYRRCTCPDGLRGREDQAAVDSLVLAHGEAFAASQGTSIAEIMRIFTEALYLQQATQDAELEEPDVFMRQRDAAIFASLDSAEEEARQRCGAQAHLYKGDCPLEGPGVAGFEHMFGTCPECGHYDNQCLKCSAVVDIGDACVCPAPVRVTASTEQLTASDDLYLSDDDYEPAAGAFREARYFSSFLFGISPRLSTQHVRRMRRRSI